MLASLSLGAVVRRRGLKRRGESAGGEWLPGAGLWGRDAAEQDGVTSFAGKGRRYDYLIASRSALPTLEPMLYHHRASASEIATSVFTY